MRPTTQRPRPAALLLLLLGALAVALAPSAEAAARATAAAASGAAFTAAARAVDAGGVLTVTGYRLEGENADATLKLKRFEAWKPDAVVWIQAAVDAPPLQRAPPATRFFRGTIAGNPRSSVMLAVREDGGVDGVARRGNASWALGRPGTRASPGGSPAATAAAAAAPLASQRVRAEGLPARRPFQCGNSAPPFNASVLGHDRKLQQADYVVGPDYPGYTKLDQQYVATLAIDTDAEFLAKWGGDTDRAASYVALLVGCELPRPCMAAGGA